MPRSARKKSANGIYHVIMRGINRQAIFHDEGDYQALLETISQVKALEGFQLYAYCLMGNHLHLLLQERENTLSDIMKRIGVRYVGRYNRKYGRTGHLFQDRYKSEPVENEQYLLTVICYIHNNPIKAKIAKQPEEYKWSSCRAYLGEKEYPPGLTDVEWILELFTGGEKDSRSSFMEYLREAKAESCLDMDEQATPKISDEKLYKKILKLLSGQGVEGLQRMEKDKRDSMLRRIKTINGVTQRQIARVTGISQNIVFKA